MTDRILELISKLGLSPHQEGGYYKETYKSQEIISQKALPEAYKSDHSFFTSIYYLLTQETSSKFHKIVQDETWYFHEGASLKLHMLNPDGSYKMMILGSNLALGESFQYTVKGGSWFAAETEGEYSLVGCNVAPGFEFEDFQFANKEALLTKYIDQQDIIEKFSK